MEFIEALLQLLYEDRSITMSAAASQAYTKTLYDFHTWYTSAAFQLALKVWSSGVPCYCVDLLVKRAEPDAVHIHPLPGQY